MYNYIVKEDLKYITDADLPWNLFENSTVLISGANGFLPSYMVHTLIYLNEKYNKNIKILALVRNKKKAEKRFKDYIDRNDFKLIVQDVCKPIKIDMDTDLDFIIHAASQASPKYYGIDPIGTFNANVKGTNNLIKLAYEKKSKSFLFFSSSEIYGEISKNQIPTKESDYGYLDPLNVRSCYAEGKRAGETICICWQYQYNIPIKIARPFHIYGPGMDLNDGRVFADFARNIVNNKNIVLNSDGSATRSFCYIADAIIGFFTILLKGEAGQSYNVGFNKETSILELAEILVNLFPEKNLKVIKKEDQFNKGYIKSKITRSCPDILKIKKLGWIPQFSIQEGFKRTNSFYEKSTFN
ncbi:MAG: UDP-glucuronate decarboxylase [Candidatus Melainabacteria bacterium GWA2_34_9]|nr:MAG: UDP-glucuronate decarboxylase [Candidatus Melainabacteria bacterium GWA2_34_9]